MRTNVQLAGRQSWNIPGGSAVEIKPSPVQEKAMPVRLAGQAEVHVTQAEGGGETAEAARVVLELSLIHILAVNGARLVCGESTPCVPELTR